MILCALLIASTPLLLEEPDCCGHQFSAMHASSPVHLRQEQHPVPTEEKDYVSTYARKITKLADNVYVIRHPDAPDQFPQSNTMVVIGDRDALVVDTCYLPSAAREDIEDIKKWTNKPVRYVVNTHWHMDHTIGNATYAAAFPDVKIIAHEETRQHILGYNPPFFKRYPVFNERNHKRLDTGKEDDGTALTDARRKEIGDTIGMRDKVWAEFKNVVDVYPNSTFTGEVNLDLGNMPVKLMHLGRGNTSGDIVVYLPTLKILATGDLLDHPAPYLGGGFPQEEIRTLERMALLDVDKFVPGHGEVLTSKKFLLMTIEFMKLVVGEVSKAVYQVEGRSTNLAGVQEMVEKAVDVPAWTTRFVGDNADNRDFFIGFSFAGLVKACHAEMWRR